jgi:plastocyanin
MNGHRRKPLLIVVGAAVALALAGAAVAAVAARSSARAAATVKVTESEYHIRLSTTSVKAGNVTFVVHNAGAIAHKLDLAGGGHGTVAVGTIAPGATRTKTVKLAAGAISLWCPIPGHAALGMKAALKVAGAAAASPSPSPTAPTTSTTSDTVWG